MDNIELQGMYVPSSFRVPTEDALDFIEQSKLATLVTADRQQGLAATHLPFRLVRDEGPVGTLYGHIAKANKQWKSDIQHDGLVIFQGADAYISPSWYASKPIDGKVVPTWDYESFHVYGSVEFITDKEKLYEIVSKLTGKFEPTHSQWKVTDAPDKYIDAQLRAIVGVKVTITKIDGAKKMSQNKDQANIESLSNGLASSGNQEVANIVSSSLTKEN